MDHIAADLKNSALMPNHVAVQTIASGKRPKSLLLANDKSFHKMLDRITPGWFVTYTVATNQDDFLSL